MGVTGYVEVKYKMIGAEKYRGGKWSILLGRFCVVQMIFPGTL